MTADPRYFSTYYALDGINFRRRSVVGALETLDAAYIPIVIQEAAGIRSIRRFEEQKHHCCAARACSMPARTVRKPGASTGF